MSQPRKVIITGGSRGIGAACVRRFASSGDDVAFIYRSNDAAAQKLSSETGARCVKADLGDLSAAAAAARKCCSLLGGCDILVNCAGIAQIKLFTDITPSEWQRMIDVNLSSMYAVIHELLPDMLHCHSGRIINVGSVWGARGASCEVHYSASKAAVRGLTQALAKEMGPSGINVNCVEPGVIDTDMNSSLTEADIAELCDATPLCRTGRPEEVAAAVFFLASGDASFITGAILPVDGGFPA